MVFGVDDDAAIQDAIDQTGRRWGIPRLAELERGVHGLIARTGNRRAFRRHPGQTSCTLRVRPEPRERSAMAHRQILQLQAAPARTPDVGGNVVRLPRRGLETLGVDEGDPVLIECGARVLWARARVAHSDDEGTGVARVDATGAECPEVLAGGSVRVRPAPVQPARHVVVASEDVEDGSEAELRSALEGEPYLLAGDQLRVELEGETRGFDYDVGVAGVSLIQVVGRQGALHDASVRIVSTVPAGPVRMGSETEMHRVP